MGNSPSRFDPQLTGVTPQTISKWMQFPEFEACINRYKFTILYEGQDRLRGLSLEAIDALASLLKNSKNETIRLQAAKFIIDTVKVAPKSDDFGLWRINGPTTVEDVIRERLKSDHNSQLLIDY